MNNINWFDVILCCCYKHNIPSELVDIIFCYRYGKKCGTEYKYPFVSIKGPPKDDKNIDELEFVIQTIIDMLSYSK